MWGTPGVCGVGLPQLQAPLGIQADGSAHGQGQRSCVPTVGSEAESRPCRHNVRCCLLCLSSCAFSSAPVPVLSRVGHVSARSFLPRLWGLGSGEKPARAPVSSPQGTLDWHLTGQSGLQCGSGWWPCVCWVEGGGGLLGGDSETLGGCTDGRQPGPGRTSQEWGGPAAGLGCGMAHGTGVGLL